MKILIYIPVWNRRHITEYCYLSLKRTILNAPKELSFVVLIVASNDKDESLAREHGFEVFRTQNKPLGRKFNSGLEYALGEWNFDYLMQINSDNILSIDFWKSFLQYLHPDIKQYFFGVDRVYFYDSITKDMREFKYTTGCGIRFIRRDIVEIAGFVEKIGKDDPVFELWEPHINSGLDNNSSDNILNRAGRMLYIALNKQKRPVVTDIKSLTNIHEFKEFTGAKRPSEVHRLQIMKRFPELYEFEKAISERKELSFLT